MVVKPVSMSAMKKNLIFKSRLPHNFLSINNTLNTLLVNTGDYGTTHKPTAELLHNRSTSFIPI